MIGWLAGLYLLATVPLSAMNIDENWRHPLEGLTIWMVGWLLVAVPLTGVATVLAARMERAATGVRHAMRSGWLGVSLGVFLAAHWAVHLLWSPTYLFWALTGSYGRESHLISAVLALLAWGFFAAGVILARSTGRKLRQRDWEGATDDERRRTLPRLPTPALGALGLAMATLPGSVLAGVVAVDERSPWLALFAWGFPTAMVACAGAAWAAWAYAGLPHGREPTRSGARFTELVGAAVVGMWLPAWLMAAAPVYGASRHEEQLVASVLMALVLVGATAAWSYGRAARWAPTP